MMAGWPGDKAGVHLAADPMSSTAAIWQRLGSGAWAAGADPGFYVIDLDATLVGSHSEKQGAAPTYKKGFGFHPLLAYLDATGEALAGLLRPGNAGSGTATTFLVQLGLLILDEAMCFGIELRSLG